MPDVTQKKKKKTKCSYYTYKHLTLLGKNNTKNERYTYKNVKMNENISHPSSQVT